MSCCGGCSCRRWCYDRSVFRGRPEFTEEDYTPEDHEVVDEIDRIIYGTAPTPQPRSAVIDGQMFHLVPSMLPVPKKPWWKFW